MKVFYHSLLYTYVEKSKYVLRFKHDTSEVINIVTMGNGKYAVTLVSYEFYKWFIFHYNTRVYIINSYLTHKVILPIAGHWAMLITYSFYLLFCFQIHIVHSANNDKPRGYAFIEYEHERDMHGMYLKIFKSTSITLV